MKVLITGSEGFIGKHLFKYLKKKKIIVYPYDLYLSQDILDKKTLEKAIKKVDYIIHLAAVGDVYQAEKDPQNTLKVGIIGTQNLIDVANRYPIKKIIYASTWEVYGKPIYQPIDENHPCNPVHPYSIAKLGGELIIRSAFNKIPWIILRLGSAYGLRMRPYAVIPLFINTALKKEPIFLHGGGNQKRQFTHVDDINTAFYKSIIRPVKNEIFNIVSNEVITIKQIAKIIIKKIPTKIKIEKERIGDVPSAIICSLKAKKKLNWQAKIKLQEGINFLINLSSQ